MAVRGTKVLSEKAEAVKAEAVKAEAAKSAEAVIGEASFLTNALESTARERTIIHSKSHEAVDPVQDLPTQRKRPDLGRYLLQVDHQTKRSYADADAAQAAALKIKAGHPILQVAIYDATECVIRTIELPQT
jgi:hypothetical protein